MIRQANKYDIEDLIGIIKSFAEQSDLAKTGDPMKWSKLHVEWVLTQVLGGLGFVLIDDKKTSILVAIRSPLLWIPNSYQLQEVMLFSPSKIVMVKLIKEYAKIAKKMLQDEFIIHATIPCSIDSDFSKLDMKKIENMWEINHG